MLKFAYTIFYVPDVQEAISFYEKAFGFQRKFIAPENEYGELNTGDTTLSFCSIALAKTHFPDGFLEPDPAKKPFGVEVAFVTDDVATVYNNAVAAGARSLAGPEKKPWGQTVAYVRDNNGYLIEICTPVQ